jgi:hypothetical protein
MLFRGNGMVWDPEKNCVLCTFKDGELHTKDKRVKEFLQDHDFEYEEEDGDLDEDDQEEHKDDDKSTVLSNNQIKELLDKKGIEYDKKANKETLLKLLEGAE